MGLSNYPPGVSGNEPQITGDYPMLEAQCNVCGETFIPADEADTVHLEREDGSICGGDGTILGEWV